MEIKIIALHCTFQNWVTKSLTVVEEVPQYLTYETMK